MKNIVNKGRTQARERESWDVSSVSSMQTVDRSRAEIDWPILTVKRAPLSKHSNPILMISPWVTQDNKVNSRDNLYRLLELN